MFLLLGLIAKYRGRMEIHPSRKAARRDRERENYILNCNLQNEREKFKLCPFKKFFRYNRIVCAIQFLKGKNIACDPAAVQIQ